VSPLTVPPDESAATARLDVVMDHRNLDWRSY